jgi:hypothetical protein
MALDREWLAGIALRVQRVFEEDGRGALVPRSLIERACKIALEALPANVLASLPMLKPAKQEHVTCCNHLARSKRLGEIAAVVALHPPAAAVDMPPIATMLCLTCALQVSLAITGALASAGGLQSEGEA